MILWHLGVATVFVYVTLGRSRIDYRFILIGAVAPDLVDGLLGLVVFDGDAGRLAAHSLLAAVVVAVAILIAFKGDRRLSLFGLAVGWVTHLVADGMWQAPRTFLWPLFGLSFADGPEEPYSWSVITDPAAHLSTWAGEVIGAGVLLWFWVAFELSDPERRARFFRDGRLRA